MYPACLHMVHGVAAEDILRVHKIMCTLHTDKLTAGHVIVIIMKIRS